MRKYLLVFFTIVCAVSLNVYSVLGKNSNRSNKTILKIADSDATVTAKATLAAHGGDKFKNAKTIVMRGSVEVSAPNSTQTLPAAFNMILAGEKYRFDIAALPMINFQQIFDGEQTYSSMAGISLPPINRLGLPLLAKIDTPGFVVAELPEKLKKKKGFRITSPEGYYTDFIIDEKTSQVKEYESSYEINGRSVTTSVSVDKYRDVDGIFLTERFSQRLDMGQFTSYANFKAKEITINTEISDDVFKLGSK